MRNKFTGKVERLMNRLITMSIYEKLNKGETVDKAQLAFMILPRRVCGLWSNL
jgi:hypothetical protein